MGRLDTYLLIVILLIFSKNISFGQSIEFKEIPKEEIFVTLNSNLFVTGENLYYKLYCFNKGTNTFSTISKIGHVLLVNDSKKIVFNQKLNLKNGIASGDYYIPPSLTTGNYKLVAYTNWMLNNPINAFQSIDIHIVNPFSRSKETSLQNIDSIVVKNFQKQTPKNTNNNIQLEIKSNLYKTRSKVSFRLRDFNDFGTGSYMVSVRKVDAVEIISNHKPKSSERLTIEPPEFILPEMRGELISGSLVLKNNKTKIADKIVSMSIVGNKNIYKIAKTNKEGKFYFNLHENYTDGKLLFQVINVEREKFEIVLDDYSFKYLDTLSFNQVVLDQNIENWLVKKSIQNQIESAFFKVKKDSLLPKELPRPFYGSASLEYILDDYTRFPTLKETLVEVVKGAAVRKIKGEQRIVLLNPQNDLKNRISNLKPLFIIDGIPIQNHEILLDYPTIKIEKISIINTIYFYKSSIYDGIFTIDTKKGNFNLPNNEPHYTQSSFSPIDEKIFFYQDYGNTNNKLEKIPDYRTQLLWMPNVVLNRSFSTIEFYTSDVDGEFEIKLEGYSKDGSYRKISKYIEVVKD